MKKRLIAPLVAITIGFYSIINALFYATDGWRVAVQVMFGLAILIVGLCILDDVLNRINEERRRAAIKKEAEDQVHREALAKHVAEIERAWEA